MNVVDDRLLEAQATIRLLQDELAATNREVLLLTLELDRRVEQRTAQLEEANRELEAFSHSISHDLRAPLRHIKGFLELLLERSGPALDAEGRKHLNYITTACDKMSNLIEGLLKFARSGRAKLRKSRIDLNVLVREVIHEMEPETRDRNIVWDIALLPRVHADVTLLRQVWFNLIANAVKYTRKRNSARIEIGQVASEKNEIVLFVRDNGVGFDMQTANKLFGVFERLHSEREFEGTGIGLANAQRIVSRHGGRIWAEAKSGVGATFFFTLPDETSDDDLSDPIVGT